MPGSGAGSRKFDGEQARNGLTLLMTDGLAVGQMRERQTSKMILEYRGVVVGSESCTESLIGERAGGFLMVTLSRRHLGDFISFVALFPALVSPCGSEFALLGHFFFLKLLPPAFSWCRLRWGACCSYHTVPHEQRNSSQLQASQKSHLRVPRL